VNLTNASGYNIVTTLTSVFPTRISGTVTVPPEVLPGSWTVEVITVDGGTGSKNKAVTII
jgi:hypothetical protein